MSGFACRVAQRSVIDSLWMLCNWHTISNSPIRPSQLWLTDAVVLREIILSPYVRWDHFEPTGGPAKNKTYRNGCLDLCNAKRSWQYLSLGTECCFQSFSTTENELTLNSKSCFSSNTFKRSAQEWGAKWFASPLTQKLDLRSPAAFFLLSCLACPHVLFISEASFTLQGVMPSSDFFVKSDLAFKLKKQIRLLMIIGNTGKQNKLPGPWKWWWTVIFFFLINRRM